MNWLTPTNAVFTEGDKVVLCKGNVPYRGVIVRRYPYVDLPVGEALAFEGEHRYFDWLDNCRDYLTKDATR